MSVNQKIDSFIYREDLSTENTLVIGIDIDKKKHFACAIDERGRGLQKSFPIIQSRAGFKAFYGRLLVLKEAHKNNTPRWFRANRALLDELSGVFNELQHSIRHGQSDARQRLHHQE